MNYDHPPLTALRVQEWRPFPATLRTLHKHPETTASAESSWMVLTDFDGTISLNDVTDHVLEHLALPGVERLESQWLNGELGSRDCLQGQIALLRASPEMLDAVIDSVAIDPGFVSFVELCQQQGISVKIVSDGLDYAISRILRRHGLGHLKIAANHLHYLGDHRWELQFPYARPDCKKASGNCKCARVEQRQLQGYKILYIGDSTSDFCVSGQVEMVLAKDKLINYCQEQRIPHRPIQGFWEARMLLPELLQLPQMNAREARA